MVLTSWTIFSHDNATHDTKEQYFGIVADGLRKNVIYCRYSTGKIECSEKA